MENKGKKPKLFCFLICDRIIKEEGTGNASIIGVFNRIFAPRFPAVHARIAVFTIWEWQKKKKKFFETIRIVGPKDELIREQSKIEVNFNENANRAYAAINFLNVRFPNSGIYKVQLYFEGELERETSLEVVQVSSKQ